MGPRSCCLALVAIAAIVPAMSRAQAPVVAVAPFEGRRSAPIRRLIARALRDRADVVSRRASNRAAAEAGLEGTSESGVRRFADAVNADLVVLGSVRGNARRARVRLVVRADDGEELASERFVYRRGRRGRTVLDDAVSSIWDRALAAWRALNAPAPVVEEVIDEPDDGPEPNAAPEDGLAVLAATVGITLRSRDSLVTLAMGGERRYSVPTYVELGLGLEVRPFAHEGHLGRGTYANAEIFHSVGLASEVDDPSTPMPVEGTSFLRFAVNVGWMAPAGEAVELGVGFGGGYDGYSIGTNRVLPSVEVAFLRPAARARVRFAEETLVLEIDVAYRAILGIGPVADSFGVDVATHGVDFAAGFTGNLIGIADLGFTWSARFSYVGYFMSYAGAPTDVAGTSGSEQAIRFALMVGWSF